MDNTARASGDFPDCILKQEVALITSRERESWIKKADSIVASNKYNNTSFREYT